MWIIASVFKIVFTLIFFFNRTTHQDILFLIWNVGLLRFCSYMLWNVLVSLLLSNDGLVCCCLLSFIASLSVELVFLSVFLFGWSVLFHVVLHVVEVFFGVFAGLDFGLCCWFWYFESFFLADGSFCVLASWFGSCLSYILKSCLNYFGVFAWWVAISCFGCFLLDIIAESGTR